MYIISTSVANNVKDRHYTVVLSMIHDRERKAYALLPWTVQTNFRISNIVRGFLVLDGQPLTQCRTLPDQLHHQCRGRASLGPGAPGESLRCPKEPSVGRRRHNKLGRSQKDQELFIEHNLRPFDSPTDWTFEPCSSYYDTVSEMGLLVSSA